MEVGSTKGAEVGDWAIAAVEAVADRAAPAAPAPRVDRTLRREMRSLSDIGDAPARCRFPAIVPGYCLVFVWRVRRRGKLPWETGATGDEAGVVGWLV